MVEHPCQQCCRSGMFIPDAGRIRILSIPDSRVEKIPDPGSASQNLSLLTQKMFLSSRKCDPGCPDLVLLPIPYPGSGSCFLPFPDPIPDPGGKKAPDPGSGSATLLVSLSLHVFRVWRWTVPEWIPGRDSRLLWAEVQGKKFICSFTKIWKKVSKLLSY